MSPENMPRPDEFVRATTGGRRERRRLETRERLYESAMRLLAERDFDAVTVEMITEAADVGKGTFFNYFPNKEAVVSYRFERVLQLLTEMMHAPEQEFWADAPAECLVAHSQAIALGGPVWKRIIAITHTVGQLDTQSPRLERNLLALSLTNDAVRTAHLNLKSRIRAIAEAMIQEGQANGEFRTDVTARNLNEYMMGVYFNVLFSWVESEGQENFHIVLDRTFAIAWRSMANPDYTDGEPE